MDAGARILMRPSVPRRIPVARLWTAEAPADRLERVIGAAREIRLRRRRGVVFQHFL
jgi:hypothetical protein